MKSKSLAVHQISRPHGWPIHENFVFVEEAVPRPVPGTALVENV
jgi:hypothetical protein